VKCASTRTSSRVAFPGWSRLPRRSPIANGPRLARLLSPAGDRGGGGGVVSVANVCCRRRKSRSGRLLACIAAASLLAGAFPESSGVGAARLRGCPLSPRRASRPAPPGKLSIRPVGLCAGLGPRTRRQPPLGGRCFPWAGVTLIVLGADETALLGETNSRKSLEARPSGDRGPPARAWTFAEPTPRLYPISHAPSCSRCCSLARIVLGEPARHDRERYIAACRPACVASGGRNRVLCARACEFVAAAG